MPNKGALGKVFKKEAKVKGKNAGLDFNQRLSQKGHAGKLIFDHDAEKRSDPTKPKATKLNPTKPT